MRSDWFLFISDLKSWTNDESWTDMAYFNGEEKPMVGRQQTASLNTGVTRGGLTQPRGGAQRGGLAGSLFGERQRPQLFSPDVETE